MRTSVPALLLFVAACSSSPEADPSFKNEVQKFLDRYGERYQALVSAQQEAQWASNTRIVEGDTTNDTRAQKAEEALAAFTGSIENIELARTYQKRRRELPFVQQRQIDAILFRAGASPQIVPDLVKARIEADIAQSRALYGYKFQLDGREVTPNELDQALQNETDLEARRRAWESSKEVGIGLRDGLVHLRELRNDTVQALGYRDYFTYRASEYGMSTRELDDLVERVNRELRPLFVELHTWMRYELAKRHGVPVPDLLPAHWLPDRWGQDWSPLLAKSGGFDLDAALAQKKPEWVTEQAERFYQSLGFEPLPRTFWERSSLYPVAKDANFKKNTHASAWHVDLDRDVRCLMSVEPNAQWYETAHHELGHIYYFLEYSTPKIPVVLRDGANPAYHEAMGTLMGFAAMKPAFLRSVGIDTGAAEFDPMQVRLREALNYVVFIPWSAGVMYSFEKALYYDDLPSERWNKTWWELVAKYQGIEPPSVRDERYCDAATKTHVNDDPGQYYKYALSFVLFFQLHDHIARQVLHEDAFEANYWNRREAGDFLRSIMKYGASSDWRKLLRDRTGSELSARPMVDYFEPLLAWLRKENAGRKASIGPL